MYSTLTQAASMYQAENGITYNEFDTSLTARDFMYEYIIPYIKVIKECDSLLSCYNDYPLQIDRSTKIIDVEFLTVLADGSFLGLNSDCLL